MRSIVADNPLKLVMKAVVLTARSLCMLSQYNPIDPATTNIRKSANGKHIVFNIDFMLLPNMPNTGLASIYDW